MSQHLAFSIYTYNFMHSKLCSFSLYLNRKSFLPSLLRVSSKIDGGLADSRYGAMGAGNCGIWVRGSMVDCEGLDRRAVVLVGRRSKASDREVWLYGQQREE